MSDIFQSISDMPADAIQRIVDRLEFRGRDPAFVQMRERYFDRMGLASCSRVLDLGCGTGVATRALARRNEFPGKVVGVDFSAALIDAANRFASEEGLSGRIEFRVGDSHALEDADASFDAVLAHTLISHVTDPSSTIADASRVLAPDGLISIFDGDYASITFGAGEIELNGKIVNGMLDAIVANPYVMRELPSVLKDHGLEIVEFLPEVLAEAGRGSFFMNMAESYIPIAENAGTIAAPVGSDWLSAQKSASENRTFFGACNFYTFLARKTRQ